MNVKTCKEKTFCPRLWNEIYINVNGDVFACCHEKPKVLGNIYKKKLKEICNSPIIKEFRKKSLLGTLDCYQNCKLLQKKEKYPEQDDIEIDYNQLKRIKIEFGEACNLNCIMCWQDSKNKISLDYKKLIENVDITPFEDIEIQGGEPLFIESARAYYDYLISKEKKVSFLTNGILINSEWAKKIALHSSFIYFSLNAATKKTHELINHGSRWETVLNNIQKIRTAKKKYNTSVEIHGHMTIVIENLHEIPLFIKKFHEFGFEEIDFGYDLKTVPDYLKSHPLEFNELQFNIKKAIDNSDYKGKINIFRLKLLDLI